MVRWSGHTPSPWRAITALYRRDVVPRLLLGGRAGICLCGHLVVPVVIVNVGWAGGSHLVYRLYSENLTGALVYSLHLMTDTLRCIAVMVRCIVVFMLALCPCGV